MVLTVGILTLGSLVEAGSALVGALLALLGFRWEVRRGIGSAVCLGSDVVGEERYEDKEGREHRGLLGKKEHFDMRSEGIKYGLSSMS